MVKRNPTDAKIDYSHVMFDGVDVLFALMPDYIGFAKPLQQANKIVIYEYTSRYTCISVSNTN